MQAWLVSNCGSEWEPWELLLVLARATLPDESS